MVRQKNSDEYTAMMNAAKTVNSFIHKEKLNDLEKRHLF